MMFRTLCCELTKRFALRQVQGFLKNIFLGAPETLLVMKLLPLRSTECYVLNSEVTAYIGFEASPVRVTTKPDVPAET